MTLVKPLLAIAVALVLQTTLARFAVGGLMGVDLVLVVVTYLGLTSGPVIGLLAGTVAGLAQDALASGVVGVGGLAKTTVGFLAGIVGAQFIVAQSLPQFVVFFAATILHAAVFLGLHAVLGLRQSGVQVGPVAGEALGNALVGVALVQIVAFVPATLERRPTGRSRVRTTPFKEVRR